MLLDCDKIVLSTCMRITQMVWWPMNPKYYPDMRETLVPQTVREHCRSIVAYEGFVKSESSC